MANPESKPGTHSLSTRDTDSGEPQNPFSILAKLALQIPFFNQPKKPSSTPSEEPPSKEVMGEETPKPNVVSFPNRRPVVPPLETEVQESSGKTHNPVLIWQVYAIGGFIILKWVWARWQERKERAKKASADDQQSPDDESQHPAGDEA